MTREGTSHCSGLLRDLLLAVVVVFFGAWTTSLAQYASYPYSRPAGGRSQLPNNARNIGGFTGNPYRSTGVRPTGLPVSGNVHSYYGSARGAGSLGYRAPAKPFSNMRQPQPLVSGVDAARVEIMRGLWAW